MVLNLIELTFLELFEILNSLFNGATIWKTVGILLFDHLYDCVRAFPIFDLDSETEADSEAEEAREAKTIDTENVDQNSVDSVASSTLLSEFIPIIFEEAGVSTSASGQGPAASSRTCPNLAGARRT